MNDRFLEGVAGRAAVGIGIDLIGPAMEEIQQSGGQIPELPVAQGPHRRPFDLGRSIERGRHLQLHHFGRRRLIPELRVAEQHDFVRINGVARREIREPSRRPDLVTLKYSRIALDRLHERAGFPLLRRASLAEAAATQPHPELVERPCRRRKIMSGIVIGVHGHIGVDPFEPRHHASEGAHVLAETCHRRPRRNRPVTPAGHHQLGARTELDRYRRSLRITQLLAAAGRTLWARRHVMPHDGRARQIEADHVILQVGAKVGGDRFRDLDSGELETTLSDRAAGECRNGNAARRRAVDEPLHLPVAYHAIGKTGPARALSRAEHRAHQGEDAGGLYEQPGRLVRHMPPVQFGQSSVEIVAHERDGQIGGVLHDADAQPSQCGPEILCVVDTDRFDPHPTFFQFRFGRFRR